MKNNNYHLTIVYDNGIHTSEFCNNYNCVDAYADKLIEKYKHIKIEIRDAKNRLCKLYDSL